MNARSYMVQPEALRIEIREVITALWTEGGRNGDETVSGSTSTCGVQREGSMDRAAKSKAATIMGLLSL